MHPRLQRSPSICGPGSRWPIPAQPRVPYPRGVGSTGNRACTMFERAAALLNCVLCLRNNDFRAGSDRDDDMARWCAEGSAVPGWLGGGQLGSVGEGQACWYRFGSRGRGGGGRMMYRTRVSAWARSTPSRTVDLGVSGNFAIGSLL